MLEGSEGSLSFYAPELCQGKSKNKVDGRQVDVWSLGVCIYAMTYKALPFMAKNHSNVLELLELISKAKLGN